MIYSIASKFDLYFSKQENENFKKFVRLILFGKKKYNFYNSGLKSCKRLV